MFLVIFFAVQSNNILRNCAILGRIILPNYAHFNFFCAHNKHPVQWLEAFSTRTYT